MRWLMGLCFVLGSGFVHAQLKVGAERLEDYLPLLKDQRVALMVNQSSLVGDEHLVDTLLANEVNIQSILMVEHGFRGKLGAGEAVESGQDIKTGIPLISLYGKQKTLTASQADEVDVIIYDLQDVGVRFYTYSRSLHFLLQSCQDFNKTLVVLDRPNPNGDYIAGPILEPDMASGLSVDPIPLVHGLTMGELAKMILGEGWLEGEGHCDLKVVPVANYDHNQQYSLPVSPSPNLPNDLSIRLYPSLALFEGTSVSVGRGSDWPFQVLGYPDKRMGKFEFKPRPITGSWQKLNHAGKSLYGEKISDPERFTLSYIIRWHKQFMALDIQLFSRANFFDLLAGTKNLRQAIEAGATEAEIILEWHQALKNFQQSRKKYLLYPDSDWIIRRYN